MTFDLAEMRANRDAGTADATSTAYEVYQGAFTWAAFEADQRRITLIPDMEAEIERLTAENADLRDDLARAMRALSAIATGWTDEPYSQRHAKAALASIKDNSK